MSQANIKTEMEKGEPFPLPSATVVNLINIADSTYGKVPLLSYGITIPTAGTAKYSPGGIFIDVDAAANNQVCYQESTVLSCSFVKQTT